MRTEPRVRRRLVYSNRTAGRRFSSIETAVWSELQV